MEPSATQQAQETRKANNGKTRWIGLFAGAVLFVVMLLLPAPASLGTAGWHTAATVVLMAVWWMTEAMPIPATALLPIVLLPVLGVDDVRENASHYAHPMIFLFMGGFMIALAMQRWNLHKRIALNIIRAIGTRPSSIVAGFMASAALLSLWVSNTASTLVILPVAMSVIALVPIAAGPEGKRKDHFSIALLLGLAYAANIGGLGTLIGTPTNALLVGFVQEEYGVEISFLQWMLIGIPFVLVSVPIAFLVLTKLVFPIRLKELPGGRKLIDDGIRELGSITTPELVVAVVFGLTATLWIFRPLLVSIIPGISDTGIALFGALLLFIIPVDIRRGIFVLNWEWARKLPWGVLILFGGGLSLASAISRTGLASWIGSYLEALSTWPVVALIMISVGLIIFMTELASNSATAAAFLPILATVAVTVMGKNPLILLVPATLAASCAFMLPVATPPNAIVYGSNRITIQQMAKGGLVLNLVFIVAITIAAYLLVGPVLGIDLDTLPVWAMP